VPIHVGNGHTLGVFDGHESHTLTISEIPAHIHLVYASSTQASNNTPGTARVLAATPQGQPLYGPANNLAPMSPQAVSNTGADQSHLNMQPFLTLSFCIALQGIFPPRN
jgi:microcystin-dependent protein